MSKTLWLQGVQHTRLPCPSPFPGACSNSCPLSQWCHPTILPSVIPFSSCLLCFLESVFFNDSALCIRWPKYRGFSFSVSPSNGYSGLISFRMDWFHLLAVQATLKESSPAPQLESINSLVIWLLYGPTFTSICDFWKNHSFDHIALTIWTFVGKVMSLLFVFCISSSSSICKIII